MFCGSHRNSAAYSLLMTSLQMKRGFASILQRRIGVLTGLFLITVGAPDVFACDCNPNGPPCQSYFEVDSVFVGTVRSISAAPEPLLTGMLRVEFADVQSANGQKQPVVSVLTADNDAECGYGFRTGERYVVYANRKDGGNDFQVVSCSRTQPFATASEDRQYFQTLSSPSEGSHVYGTIVRPQTDLSTGAAQLAPTVSGSLTLRGPRGTFHAKTGNDGRYDVFAIPPGKYELTAVAGPGLDAMHRSVELKHSHACVVADFAFPPATAR
jgi:hypothetical protein